MCPKDYEKEPVILITGIKEQKCSRGRKNIRKDINKRASRL